MFNKGDEVYAAWWDPALDTDKRSGKNASWYPGSILSYKTIGKNIYGPLRLYHVKYEDGDELQKLEDCWIFTKTDYELTMQLDEEDDGCGWTNVGITKRYDTKSTDMWASKVGWYEWVDIDGNVQSFSLLSDAMKAHEDDVAAREEQLEGEESVLQISNVGKGGDASDEESNASENTGDKPYSMQALAEAKRAYASMESLTRVRKKPQQLEDVGEDAMTTNEPTNGDAQTNDELSETLSLQVPSPEEVEDETWTLKELQQNESEAEQNLFSNVHPPSRRDIHRPYARQITTSLRNLDNDDNPTPEHESPAPRGATPKVLLKRQRTQDIKDIHSDIISDGVEGTGERDQSNSRNITPDADVEKPPLSDRDVHDTALETADDPLNVSSPDRNIDGQSAAIPANNKNMNAEMGAEASVVEAPNDKNNVNAEERTLSAANLISTSDKAVTSINDMKWKRNIEGMFNLPCLIHSFA